MRKPGAPIEISTWLTSVTAARDVTFHMIVDRNFCFIDKAWLNAMHKCNVSFIHFHPVVKSSYVFVTFNAVSILSLPGDYLNQVTADSYPNRVPGRHNQYFPDLCQQTGGFLLDKEKKGIFWQYERSRPSRGSNPLHDIGIGNLIFNRQSFAWRDLVLS